MTALANPSIHDYYVHMLYIEDVDKIELMTVYGVEEDGNRFRMEKYDLQKVSWKKQFWIEEENCVNFELEIVLRDGNSQTSNRIDFSDNMNYAYNVQENHIKMCFTYNSTPIKELFQYYLFLLPQILIACAFAVLIEWIIALLFKIKPWRYVIIANLISNVSMNILIGLSLKYFIFNYFLVVLVLEILVIVAEFSFYKHKYKDIGKAKLIIFTLVANIISWGFYALISKVFLLNL